MKFSKNFNFK